MTRIFISAVEPSADVLGAELMRSLKDLHGDVEFHGLGGPLMEKEGLVSLFPIQELALMGFMEVIPKLSRILKRIKETVHHIEEIQPDIMVTIDGLGFHKRVVKKLQYLRVNVPFIQYVAPAVWAWKPSRAKKIAPLFDKLLVIFPFEPPYFERHGLSTVFIGHPVTERFPSQVSSTKHHKKIVLLPGSRTQEIRRHLPIFLQAAQKLAQELPGSQFVLPTVPSLVSLISDHLKGYPLPIHLVTDAQEKYEHFQTSDFAIAASGTVSLELAMARLPAVIAYKTSRLTYEIAKRLAQVRYICMVNILIDRLLVPELIQNQCTPDQIVNTTMGILQSTDKLAQFRQGYDEAIHKLSAPHHKNPSLYAAEVIYNCLKIKP